MTSKNSDGTFIIKCKVFPTEIYAYSIQIKDVNAEINRITETRMMSINTKEDKLILFRQQASMVAHKKDNAVEQLRDIRDNVVRTEAELEEKRNRVVTTTGNRGESVHNEPVLRGEEVIGHVRIPCNSSSDFSSRNTWPSCE